MVDDDIAADVRAALAPVEADPAPAPEHAPEEVPASVEHQEAVEDRERGPDGKFVAKPNEKAQDNTNQPPAAETPVESIRPPASWSAQAKAAFLKPEPTKDDLALIQREVLKREQDVEKGFRERADQIKRYEPLEQLIAPHRSKWQMQGMDEVTAVRTLLAAQDMLEKNPEQAIAYLARSYGVTNIQAQPQPGQPQAQPATDSQENALLQRIAQLEQSVQAAQTAPIMSQVEVFRNDPANLYFDNVRDDMAALLQAGRASDLKEAYEMACWMRPDIRPLLQTAQVSVAADPGRVERAKAAGVSVTGSPSTAPIAASSGNSIEDDIRRSIQQVAGRA